MPTDPTSFGAMAYLFDQRYGIPFTSLPTTSLTNIDLDDYNVLVLPDAGGSSSYEALIGDDGVKLLKEWIQDGGTLISVAGAAAYI